VLSSRPAAIAFRGGLLLTKRVKSSRAFAPMAMGRRMRPESTIALTADRLRPNPVVSSFSTRMGTGSSNLMRPRPVAQTREWPGWHPAGAMLSR